MSGNTSPLNVVLYWHMHQPEYRDLRNGEYHLPWTYLHTIKDYVDMVAHLENDTGAKAVVNFAPVLLEQIDDYAIQLDPSVSDYVIAAANAHVSMENFDKAIDLLVAKQDTFAGDISFVMTHADILLRSGNKEQGLRKQMDYTPSAIWNRRILGQDKRSSRNHGYVANQGNYSQILCRS